MVELVLDAFGQHGWHRVGRPGPADDGDAAGDRPPVPLPPEAWQALIYALGKLATKFVSGPGAIASVLRTWLLPSPFSTRSVPIDVGYSDHIPQAIRRAVIARAGHPARLTSTGPAWRRFSHARHGKLPGTVLPRRKGTVMPKEARMGLLLGAAACLLAVMVDWVIEDLNKD